MIYRLACDVADRLRARKFPVSVFYGPERVTPTDPGGGERRIVLTHDTRRAGQVLAPPGGRRNPDLFFTREMPVRCMVYVRSPVGGARNAEHDHDCDQIVDGLLCALRWWAVEAKAGTLSFYEARYAAPEEIDGAELLNGAVYTLGFIVERGVSDTDFEGAASPVAPLAGVATEVRASIDGESYETVLPRGGE
jgi:hypothetical protein